MNESPRKRHWLRYTFSVLVLALLVWGGFRACSDSDAGRESGQFLIAQSRISNGIYIKGKERNAEAFFKDLILLVAEREEIDMRIITVSEGLATLGLGNGDYDAIVTMMIPDSINKERLAFSEPLYKIGAVLIVRKDSTVASFKEMQGKIIGIPREESTFFDVGTNSNLIFYGYDDEIDSLEDLQEGHLDGVIMNAWPAYVLTRGLFRGTLRIAGEPFTEDGIRLAALKGSRFSEELSKFNRGLEEAKKDGSFEKLLEKWGLMTTQTWGQEGQ